MAGSAAAFVSAGESDAVPDRTRTGFGAFVKDGIAVARRDRRFGLFLAAQWCGGGVGMALPFYVVVAREQGSLLLQDIAILVIAQTVGAILSNALWGWWGDRLGKLSLLRLVAAFGAVTPVMMLSLAGIFATGRTTALICFAIIFAVLGAVDNGRTIAYLGYLMEISPDHRRPAYSGYFNALYSIVSPRRSWRLSRQSTMSCSPAAAKASQKTTANDVASAIAAAANGSSQTGA